jgi:hypothetical protein
MWKTALACSVALGLVLALSAPADGASLRAGSAWRTANSGWQADWHHAHRYGAPHFYGGHYLGPGPYPYGPGPYYRAAPFPFFPFFGYGWAM